MQVKKSYSCYVKAWWALPPPNRVTVHLFRSFSKLWVKNIQYRLMIRLLGKLPWLLYNAKMSGVRAPKSNSVESAPIPPIMKNEHIQTSVKLEASLRHTTQDRKLVRVVEFYVRVSQEEACVCILRVCDLLEVEAKSHICYQFALKVSLPNTKSTKCFFCIDSSNRKKYCNALNRSCCSNNCLLEIGTDERVRNRMIHCLHQNISLKEKYTYKCLIL